MNILPPLVAGRPQSTANTIIAAGEHLVNVGRAGGTFAFRFFVEGFFKKYWTAAKSGHTRREIDVECGDINAKYST